MPTRPDTLPTPKPADQHPALRDWRCQRCFKLLGRHDGARVQLHFARGHQYFAAMPVTAICRCCGKLNELRSGKTG